MADQAEFLRQLTGRTEHTNAQGVIHGGFATEDRIACGEAVTDYRRLWLDGKQELQTVLDRKGIEPAIACNPLDEAWIDDEDMMAVDEAVNEAFFEGIQYALTRMEQAETLAMFKEGGKRNERT